MTLWLGDIEEDSVVTLPFSTHEAAGGNVAPSSALEIADIRVYKWSSATQRSSTAGMTMTSPFDSLTGVHMVEIDTSDNTDAGFWAAGNLYHILLAPDETVDGQTLTGVHLASFGIVYGAAAKQNTNIALILSRIGTPSNLGSGATVAGNLVDLEAQTDDIGTDGAGLTNLPWNAAWDAEVQSEAADAITAAALATAANLATLAGYVDTEVAAILAAVDTEVAAIKTKTDYLPSATAGAAGGLFIAGANAATSITTALTANITGNLSGSVGSVTGAVGSVTGAVGSVTGNVGGSVASVAANGITATSIATDAINAAAIKADAVTKIQTGLATPTNITAGTITTVGTTTNLTNLPAAAATAAELAKVPKSDSTVSWNATALAAINAEVDTALNTAIPGSPAANSVNERIATMDGLLLGTVAAGTHVAQSGDSYTRLGAPAGASVSADVAAVKAQTAAIETDTQDLQTQIGTDGAGLTAIGDTRLANLDATVSSRLATAGYTAPLDAAGTRTALGMASADLDTQLDAIVADTSELQTNQGDWATADVSALALEASLTDIKGATFSGATDSLEALRDRGDAAWVTADVSDLPTNSELATALASADDATLAAIAALPTDADVQTAATAALNAYDPPTNAEMVARTLVAASYFDPAADTVANVTTVATTTNLTNLPAAAALEATAQAILTDTGTTLPGTLATIAGYIDTEVAAILAAVDTEVAAILADTNELQTDLVNGGRLDLLIDAIKAKTDNLPSDPADQSAVEAAITSATSPLATGANLATLAGYVDTEVASILAAVDTEVAAILADTNELQTDWANGGRLDLILDARSSQTSVDDLPTNSELATALASADDAVLAAVADVPTVAEFEARTLLAADYTVVGDLPSVPSAADIKTALEADGSKLDHLWEMTEDDGGVRRLTANALEEAPAGGSGTADWTSDEREQIRYRLQLDGTQTAPADTDLPAVNVTLWQGGTPDLLGAGGRVAAEVSLGVVDANVVRWNGQDMYRASVSSVSGNAITTTGITDFEGTALADDSLVALVGWQVMFQKQVAGLPPTDVFWRAAIVSYTESVITVDDMPDGFTSSGFYVYILPPAFGVTTGGLTAQEIANTALLTPIGTAAAGSQMDYLADILEDTGTTIPAAIADLPTAAEIDTELSGTHGDGSWEGEAAAGGGTGYYTDTVTDGASPLDGVQVQLYTAQDRVGLAYEAYTNALGVFEMWPDPGTYYRWLDLAGYSFTQDVEVEVTEP